MGKALGGGSGWVLLSWSPARSQTRQSMGIRSLPYACGRHTDPRVDMYEHSYHLDFGAKAASYVDTFMQVIRWHNAELLDAQLTENEALGTDHTDNNGSDAEQVTTHADLLWEQAE